MNTDLVIKDLRVNVEDKEILKGLSLTIKAGAIHAIMGPNGSGKTTLAQTLMGHPGYTVTGGEVWYQGQHILEPTSAPSWACSWPSNTRWPSPA